jgi:hypothetical protein
VYLKRNEDNMKHLASEVVIVSVYESSKTPTENAANHANMLSNLDLLSVPYQSITGSYKGIEEQSIIIPLKLERVAHMIARDHNQDSYLRHHNDRTCELVYSTGKVERIGVMTEVPESIAKSKDAWSRGVDGRYFIVE